ncbi:MAG TPA: NUDIX hydrolase [Pyrinomonadaceae bacterium]|nr:NUDIX hydrolase [Pyrinomonadaceae bacterium]
MEKKNGPWTIKNTEKVHETDFFTVYKDEVIQPDGKEGNYGIVDFPPGVGVLPMDDEGNVFLVKQFRYAVGQTSLEILAGSVEDGEGPLESARREAKEEVGIEAEKWTEFGKLDMDTSIVKNVVSLFIAENLEIGEPETERTEEIETVKMKLSEAVEKVMSGEITHSISCALLLKAARKCQI